MASEVVDLFTELAALPSPPGEERDVADVVIRYLRDLGLSVDEDDAGVGSGGEKRNPGLRAAMDAATHQVDSLRECGLVSRPHSPPFGHRRLLPSAPEP